MSWQPEVLRRNPYLFVSMGLLANFVLLGLRPGFVRTALLVATFVYIFATLTHAAVVHRKQMRTYVVLLCVVLFMNGSDLTAHAYMAESRWLRAIGVVSNAATIGFLLLLMVRILRDVLTARVQNVDKVWGGISFYLLLGIFWATLFDLIEQAIPGSFDLSKVTSDDPLMSFEPPFATFFYYSHVTLSTLGFGDIAPMTRLTRSLSALEAISGQLFLAVLVAWLVARHTVRRPTDAPAEE